MIKVISLAVLILIANACVHNSPSTEYSCLTTCGMRLSGSKDCAGFQKAEDRAIGIYDYYLKSSSTCNKFKGWIVEVQEGARWSTGDGIKDGLTFCKEQKIKLGTDNWSRSVLAEELLHVVECDGYTVDKDPHDSWKNSWQREAIRRAQ